MSNEQPKEVKTKALKQEEIMEDKNKQDKFLQLLGGKKPQNKEATANWLKKSRTKEEEKTLAEGLEQQYTTQMSQVVQGKTKRHEGIGYALPSENSVKPAETLTSSSLDNSDSTDRSRKAEKDVSTQQNRNRSRSPLDRKKTENDQQMNAATEKNLTLTNKKQFYMQFKKSSD